MKNFLAGQFEKTAYAEGPHRDGPAGTRLRARGGEVTHAFRARRTGGGSSTSEKSQKEDAMSTDIRTQTGQAPQAGGDDAGDLQNAD